MELEKLQKIIAEVLNVDTQEVSMDTTFVEDLGADLWTFFKSSWVSRRNLISRSPQNRWRRSYP